MQIQALRMMRDPPNLDIKNSLSIEILISSFSLIKTTKAPINNIDSNIIPIAPTSKNNFII